MKSKVYKIKPTKAQFKIMKEYWKRYRTVEAGFYRYIGILEREMSKETGIKNLEFFKDEMIGEIVGIGQYDKKMNLIQREELE